MGGEPEALIGGEVTGLAVHLESYLVAAANRRYLEFVSALEDSTVSTKSLDKISKPKQDGGRTY